MPEPSDWRRPGRGWGRGWDHGRGWDDKRGWDGTHWAKARRRPPWWPENEPWPPQDAAAWRELRRGFMRRAGCFVVVVVFVLFLILVALVSLIAPAIGQGIYAIVGSFIIILFFAAIVRAVIRIVRGTAAPVGDLIEAAGRVEAGELDVKVPERGMREVRGLARAFNAMSARLSATERERRRLLAEVSHELRTPLTVIQGNIEAMLDGVYPADREHLERIRSETRQLEQLIEDLRTLSLAETGQLRMQREPTDVDALAREVGGSFEAEALTAGVELAIEAPDDLPELEVDARRVRQVISNLVANALRHTPRGGRVTVSAETLGRGIKLTVADTGVGMSADAVQHAFERFWRSGEFGGAGLGLAIVKDLVEAHGGTVEIESEVGQGTEVRCIFPG